MKNPNTRRRALFGSFGCNSGHWGRTRGFALVELLVAIAIFGIITLFVMVAYSRISGQLFLTTLAYEIALSFRQAQSYGVSVHEFGSGQTGTFDNGYGLHFESSANPASLTSYVMFSDAGGVDGDGRFNSSYGAGYDISGCFSGNVECISVSKLEKSNRIEKFCGMRSLSGDEECSSGTAVTVTSLDISFLRPNPDAVIRTDLSSIPGVLYKAAEVHLISPTGNRRKVEVWNTGQISIKTVND